MGKPETPDFLALTRGRPDFSRSIAAADAIAISRQRDMARHFLPLAALPRRMMGSPGHR
jgi:hypothetical protein